MSWPATPKALRVTASYDTRSTLVVCDQLEILGNPVVAMDEVGLLLTDEEHYPYGLWTMIASLEAIGGLARGRRGRGDGIPQRRPRQPPAAAQRRPANGAPRRAARPCAWSDASERIDVDEPVPKGVVAVADDLDASVIVVGSRGLSGAREVLERSLWHDLARRAGRPVPIVLPAATCG